MSQPLITIDFPARSIELMKRLEAFPTEILEAVRVGMDKGAEVALGAITTERFKGKGPFPVEDHRLGVETNRLWESLQRTPARISGETVTASMGSNLPYFAVHEFGFAGDVAVKSFERHVSASQFREGGKTAGELLPKGLSKKSRKEALGMELVKAHTRHVDFPARSPLGHGLADHMADLTRNITRALKAAWAGHAPQEGGAE